MKAKKRMKLKKVRDLFKFAKLLSRILDDETFKQAFREKLEEIYRISKDELGAKIDSLRSGTELPEKAERLVRKLEKWFDANFPAKK